MAADQQRDLDLFSPEMMASPWATYARLRSTEPVHFDERTRSYMLSSYRTVRRAFAEADGKRFAADHRSWALSTGQSSPVGVGGGRGFPLLHDDPPEHARLRRLVGQAFTRGRVEAMEPWVRAIATELLEDHRSAVAFDFMQGFAIPLPIKVIATMMGVPEERWQDFRRWSDATLGVADRLGGRSAKDRLLAEQWSFFEDMVETRRREPGDDLISDLARAEDGGESLSPREIVSLCVLLLVAGNETTTNLIGNMLNVLLDRPDLWERLRTEPALIVAVVEETLRYDSPVHISRKYALEQTELDGARVPAGAKLRLLLAAANRDPEVFHEPDEFRPERDDNAHIAFGYGIHYCLGAALARLEARVALEELLRRYRSAERAGVARRQTVAPGVGGYERLEVLFTP